MVGAFIEVIYHDFHICRINGYTFCPKSCTDNLGYYWKLIARTSVIVIFYLTLGPSFGRISYTHQKRVE